MDPLPELAGESPVIEAVRDQIRRLVAHRETGQRLSLWLPTALAPPTARGPTWQPVRPD